MTYKRPIKRNRNNTMRAKKNMRKRNSYRYSGRGGFIEGIRNGINNATQTANSRLSAVAAGITKSKAFNKLGKVKDLIYDDEYNANAANREVEKAAKKVDSIKAKLAKHQGENDKLNQELTKAVAEHMDAKTKHETALKKLAPAPAPAPAPRPPMPAPRRPMPPRRPMARPGSTMKRPLFNRANYGK